MRVLSLEGSHIEFQTLGGISRRYRGPQDDRRYPIFHVLIFDHTLTCIQRHPVLFSPRRKPDAIEGIGGVPDDQFRCQISVWLSDKKYRMSKESEKPRGAVFFATVINSVTPENKSMRRVRQRIHGIVQRPQLQNRNVRRSRSLIHEADLHGLAERNGNDLQPGEIDRPHAVPEVDAEIDVEGGRPVQAIEVAVHEFRPD